MARRNAGQVHAKVFTPHVSAVYQGTHSHDPTCHGLGTLTAVICSGDATIYYHGVQGSENDTGLSSGLEAVMGNNLSFSGSVYTCRAISLWKRQSSEGSSASNEVGSIEIR